MVTGVTKLDVLKFKELLILRLIAEAVKEGKPLRRDEIFPHLGVAEDSFVNQWLNDNRVPQIHSGVPYSSNKQATHSMQRLNKAKAYISDKTKGYSLTSHGEEILKRIGDDWENYPIEIPINEDGSLDWDNAEYVR